jgi:spermidine/putrescine transport system permease protein
MRRPRLGTSLLATAYILFLVYLLVPILLIALMSLRDARLVGFPITDWTFNWYRSAIVDTQFLSAFGYSLFIALATTFFALIIGVLAAMLLAREKLFARAMMFALFCLPAVIPGIVAAVSMRMFIRAIDVPTGTLAIILGHTSYAVPFVILMVLGRYQSMPRSLVDAARDLGADNFVAFIRVTLPYLRPSLIGGAIFCMLLSFDDFVRTFFLGGYEATLPILIFAKLRSGMSPELSAMATIAIIVTVSAGLYAERMTRRTEPH